MHLFEIFTAINYMHFEKNLFFIPKMSTFVVKKKKIVYAKKELWNVVRGSPYASEVRDFIFPDMCQNLTYNTAK